MRVSRLSSHVKRANPEDGFTMIFALLTLLISGLLVAAAFSAASGDIRLTSRTSTQAKAYYAAVAGVNRYQDQLTGSPESWTKCPAIGTEGVPKTVTGATGETYFVKTLGSTGHTCESEKQSTILETSGAAKGTFRILSTGSAKEGSTTVTRRIVATFSHPGFTKYVYESNYEVEDPVNLGEEPSVCEHYYAYRLANHLTSNSTCPPIEFAPEDKVNGPLHTNDAAAVCSSGSSKPTFGREGHEDEIAMNGGYYTASGCGGSVQMNGKYTTSGASILPPSTDVELLEAAGKKYNGRTEIELKSGTPNMMTVKNKAISGGSETIAFPSNGVIYVENSKAEACAITNYSPFNSDTVNDTGCGNVYVHGKYTESLTIASADDVIVNGNLTTSTESNGEPTGTATLGLIAENFVRVYHPVESTYPVASYTPATQEPVGEECITEVKLSGKLTSRSRVVKNLSSTTGLKNGTTVSGTGVPSGTTIKSVKNGTEIELSKEATSTTTSTLTFKTATGYTYYSGISKCVAPPESGYTFHESERLDAKSCKTFRNESNETVTEEYAGSGTCKYYNTSKGCDAENDTAGNDPNRWGSLENPVVDAAILSTNHSWIVDNYKCGEKLGGLTVWGSIAQFWRGPVGTGGGTGTGYIKNYNYDERLASQEPPSFLSPTNVNSWKLTRETAPPTSFTG
jgi:hypothetical protein